MAKIKWDPAATPLNNEHDGYTFQRNNYGFSMFPASRSARKRYERQWLRQHPNQKAVTQWRNMPQSVKDQWALFASTFPQPSNKDPNVFLNGFELFVKRNYFCFLNHGIHSDFMLEPEIIELPAGTIDFQIAWSDHAINCTELYIKNFGILPQVGQYVILYAAIYAEYSGQFFTPVIETIRVDEIYLDGLFCTVTVPEELESVTISVYLSKVFHQSVHYAGTKPRYMGCFTKKKFIELTDTPASYAGQAGKVPKVNPTENGLIFDSGSGCDYCLPVPTAEDAGKVPTVNPAGDDYQLEEAGGGGLTCEDLADCPTFQDLQDQLNSITNYVLENLPPQNSIHNLGLLYNHFVLDDPRSILPSGWQFQTDEIMENLVKYLDPAWTASSNIAGGKMKSTNPLQWESENVGADNSSGFTGIGSGSRDSTSGSFSALGVTAQFWYITQQSAGNFHNGVLFNYRSKFQTSISYYNYSKPAQSGLSIRLVKAAPGVSDGITGIVYGNTGIPYRYISINGYYFMIDNLAETFFNNGDPIPEVTDDATWASLSTPALCAMNNDWSKV